MDNTFIVNVDKHTGIHNITIDEKYVSLVESHTAQRTKRAIDNTLQHGDAPASEIDNDTTDNHYHVDNGTEYDPQKQVSLRLSPDDINTFYVVEDPKTLLHVQNVQHRLVITLPNSQHDLKSSRFFLVLYGRGSSDLGLNQTLGNLFFRQDQPHIDLFVFFSVFFSCFFLFLAACVLVWKFKQAYDTRRSRHRRRLEMINMASRPFSQILVCVNEPNTVQISDVHPLLPHRKGGATLAGTLGSGRVATLAKMGSKYSLNATNMVAALNSHHHLYHYTTQQQHHPQLPPGGVDSSDTFSVNPLAIEPMSDGVAAVGTFYFELPGGADAPVKACLGSTLLTMRLALPNLHYSHPVKTTARRRTSCNSTSQRE